MLPHDPEASRSIVVRNSRRPGRGLLSQHAGRALRWRDRSPIGLSGQFETNPD